MELRPVELKTDVLIIGGGAAGCFAALTLAEKSNLDVVIAEKANIKRSGCLAAGVNAFNAYINQGETPDTFVDYVKSDSEGIVREDLVYGIAKRFNEVTRKAEILGVPILKDKNGNYLSRGKRGIKINGENIKPLLASAVASHSGITVINRLNIMDYISSENKVYGAYGFSVEENIFYIINARAVICATGGAAGLYRPNNPGFSRHKMWYCPFNTGAGYAMGIRAGAEMTTFEMRFIALRCKDTISPTGTIANGLKVSQVNSRGEEYTSKYGSNTTPVRLYATVQENLKNNGPCYLQTRGISGEQQKDLYKAYLNMSPAQTIKWMETEKQPSKYNIEIEGTEPYIVGGHAASGYWVDGKRQTTLEGLFAAGDVAGGSPKKYVTGCFAEAQIAAESVIEYINEGKRDCPFEFDYISIIGGISAFLKRKCCLHSAQEVEEAMQNVMDEYAGGISQNYIIENNKLAYADRKISELLDVSHKLKAEDLHRLMFIHEIIDRLYVCRAVIHHLGARKETRWYCYQNSLDFPGRDDANYTKYVNSVYEKGSFRTILRGLVGRNEVYEHKNRQPEMHRVWRVS